MSEVDLVEVRGEHGKHPSTPGACSDPLCLESWPCKIVRLCDEIERLRAAAALHIHGEREPHGNPRANTP